MDEFGLITYLEEEQVDDTGNAKDNLYIHMWKLQNDLIGK